MSLGLLPNGAVAPEGPEAGLAPEGNLAYLDGTTNPATAVTQIINGTRANVMIQLQTAGSYTLTSPTGQTWNKVTQGITWIQRDIPMSPGTWILKNALGAEVTRFSVADFDGTWNELPDDQIQLTELPAILCGGAQIANCYGPYFLGRVRYDGAAVPKCSVVPPAPTTYFDLNLPDNVINRIDWLVTGERSAGLADLDGAFRVLVGEQGHLPPPGEFSLGAGTLKPILPGIGVEDVSGFSIVHIPSAPGDPNKGGYSWGEGWCDDPVVVGAASHGRVTIFDH